MRKFLLSAILFAFISIGFAQEQNDFNYKLSGFVKSDYWLDTRQVINAREGLFLFIPSDIKPDRNGNDINEGINLNFSAITSRLIFNLKAKEVFGAKSSGYLEADFSGASNAATNNFRLRHAYLKLDWKGSQLVLGQTWNPIFTTDCYPSILSLNTGAPFQPFIRNPQISFTKHLGKFDLLAAAITQRDNANIVDAVGTRDYAPMTNSGLPNLHLQFKFNNGKHFAGIGADYKWLRPKLATDSNYKTTSTISSFAFLAYYRLKAQNFDFKLKGIYGQNLNENLMLGGFGIHEIDTVKREFTYTPTNHFFVWSNFTYTIKKNNLEIVPGIFVGYLKNLGTSQSLVDTKYLFAMGGNIDQMYRVSPAINIKSGPIGFSLEYEYTSADYGTINLSNGNVINTHTVANHRVLFTAFYFF